MRLDVQYGCLSFSEGVIAIAAMFISIMWFLVRCCVAAFSVIWTLVLSLFLLLGSAGLLLLTPSARSDRIQHAMFPENQPRRRPAHSLEAQIGRKLQMIGDQFYQEHMLVSHIILPVYGIESITTLFSVSVGDRCRIKILIYSNMMR